MLSKIFSLLVFSCILIAVSLLSIGYGLTNAPEPAKMDETMNTQQICDLSRKEPWKPEIKTTCSFLQDWWKIDYTCDKKLGCVARDGKNYN